MTTNQPRTGTTPAFLLEQDLTMSVGTRTLAEPGPDEALVRVAWAGLCGSDLHVMRTGSWVREWPATLGHEIYGTVESAPSGADFAPGDHVVADSRVPCNACFECVAGHPGRCVHPEFVGEAFPGGFAERCVLPISLLHHVPEGAPGDAAALSEPLAVVLHGLSLLRSEPRRVLVIGHGPIGALVLIELQRRLPEVQVDVAEPVSSRAALAREQGARVLDPAAGFESAGYDTVVDAAGYASSLGDAIAACRPRGQVLVLALSSRPLEVVPAGLVEGEVAIFGSHAFVTELPEALQLLAAEPKRYLPVVTRVVSLAELPGVARAQLSQPDAVKVLVRP